MSNLTQQIAGAYIGAQVRNYDNSLRYKLGDLNITEKNIHRIAETYKLILTPISAISDEDAVEVVKMVGYHASDKGNIVKAFISMNNEIVLEFEGYRYRIQLEIPVIDYLRSRNYDLGYMGIKSLIDAGIAISSLDKTSSNVQP